MNPFLRLASLKLTPLATLIPAIFSTLGNPAWAEDTLGRKPTVVISSPPAMPAPAADGNLKEADLAPRRAATGDTAQLLRDVPGVALSGAGGVSSLPVIRGMADDRNRIKVDGMDLISACGNHMNPPLSYLDPNHAGSIRVHAGIAPVSVGGDAIGGTVVVTPRPPRFAVPGAGTLSSGELGAFYRANGDGRGAHASATLAGENLSFSYSGATAESGNLKAARAFKPGTGAIWTRRGDHWLAGDTIGSSAYKTENHRLDVALRNDNHLFDFSVGVQHIPHQGFPTQHMDMTDNRSTQFKLGYNGRFAWGQVQARVYQEETHHKMDFDDDKLYWYGTPHNVAGMPMETRGRNLGASLKADILLNDRDTLRLGSDIQHYRLNDWWPPVANSMMMSPNTFWNIHHGRRDRFELFGEWEANWSARWLTLFGLRGGQVRMDSGTVQGYNAMAIMYGNDATRFNASARRKTDDNLDLTALARYTPDATRSYEGGYARKTRSPSLYERYTWSTNGMAMTMNNWLNDGNGYVGDINLRPEVAHTLSFTADLHDAERNLWGLKATPHVSHVENYIDARCLTTCTARQFNYLQLVNRTARLTGIDIAGFAALGRQGSWGDFDLRGVVSYVNGKDTANGEPLYNIMPLNARLSLEQRLGNWTHTVESVLVAAKTRISGVRNEMRAGGYGLLNLRSAYEDKHFRIDFGIDNALNKFYAQPLGGAYIGQGTTMSLNGAGTPYGIPVPGVGRSIYAGVTLRF